MILVVFFVMLVSYAQVSKGAAIRIQEAVTARTEKVQSPGGAGVAARQGQPAGEEEGREERLAMAWGVLRGALAKANLSREGVLEWTRSGWSIALAGTVFFTGDGGIRETMQPFLREVARAAKQGGLAVRVETFGPAAGAGPATRASWADPALRAAAVTDFLAREGVRSLLSFRGHAGRRAGDDGDVTIAVLWPAEAKR
jgi:hypothetical protein